MRAGPQGRAVRSDWLEQLARVYAQTNDKDKQIGVLKHRADGRRRHRRPEEAGRLLLEKQQYADAEKAAREAIEIDIRDAEARDDLLKR